MPLVLGLTGQITYNVSMGRLSKYEQLLLLVTCGIGYVIVFGPQPGAWYHAPAESLTSADPKAGISVSLPKADIDGVPVAQRPTLIVLAGSCTGCSVDAFDPRRLKIPDDWQLAVIYSTAAAKIPQGMRPTPRRHLIISDQSSRYDVLLNATWHPRWYVLDKSQKLSELSASPNTWPKGVRYED